MSRVDRSRALGPALAALALLQVLGVMACIHELATPGTASAAAAEPPPAAPSPVAPSPVGARQPAQASASRPVGSVDASVAPRAALPPVPVNTMTPAAPAGSPLVAATRVTAPAIALDTALVPLGLDAAGALAVPEDPGTPGWFTGAAVPGELGPTVLAGHVDSRSGPAVFFRLRELQPGDMVAVTRSDGHVVWYRVDRVQQHDKGAFPTEAVYGPTSDSQLRLVTCGGTFDHAARSYRANIVVFASLVAQPAQRR